MMRRMEGIGVPNQIRTNNNNVGVIAYKLFGISEILI